MIVLGSPFIILHFLPTAVRAQVASTLYNIVIHQPHGAPMADNDLLVRVLDACARSAPAPVFPATYASEANVERAILDTALDRLRLGGFLQIAGWEKGKGQGYTLTAAGADALRDPRLLDRPPPALEPLVRPANASSTWDRGETIRAALIEPGPPMVTMGLLFVNLLMFTIGMMMALARGISLGDYFYGSGPTELSRLMVTLGSLAVPRVVIDQEWWRLLSYQFLHGGLLHLGMNMFSLFFMGPLLEAVWGSKRFLALYLFAGLCGGAAILLGGRSAVGASGALAGLLTSFVVWLQLNRDCLPENLTATWMSKVGFCLMILVLVSLGPNVSWEGHLGGAVGGALFSLPLHYQRFGRPWQRWLSWFALLALPLTGIATAYLMNATRRADLVNRRLIEQYVERFRSAESFLLERHNRFLVPLAREVPAPWKNNPEFLVNLRQACKECLVRLDSLQAQLADFTPRDEAQTSEARNIRSYFAAWRELFQNVERLLEEPGRWNTARRRAVNEQIQALFELRKPLEENSALPRFVPLVPVDEPPPPAKPPPNTA